MMKCQLTPVVYVSHNCRNEAVIRFLAIDRLTADLLGSNPQRDLVEVLWLRKRSTKVRHSGYQSADFDMTAPLKQPPRLILNQLAKCNGRLKTRKGRNCGYPHNFTNARTRGDGDDLDADRHRPIGAAAPAVTYRTGR
jgi:hypothetical protein